jgi:hypothetical protein
MTIIYFYNDNGTVGHRTRLLLFDLHTQTIPIANNCLQIYHSREQKWHPKEQSHGSDLFFQLSSGTSDH